MTHPANSSWSIHGNQQPSLEASITVRTMFDNRSNPLAISFHCSRSAHGVDKRICNLFKNAIQGNAHLDMKQNLLCSHSQVTGGCGNLRGSLSECRCEVLDRVKDPSIRRNYENLVIKTILQLLSNSMQSFHLKLAIFCSGGLLGEQVLLFRLLNELARRQGTGTIELFLIDHCYSQAIQNSHHNNSFKDSIGGEDCIAQFLEEICGCLPQNITVNGTFFDSSEKYIQIAQHDANFKHHLLIGADIEDSKFDMGKIGSEAGLGTIKPIALIKTETPAVCTLDPVGNLENCYDPRDVGQTHIVRNNAVQNRPTQRNNDNTPLIIGASVILGLVLALFFVAGREKTN